MKNFCRKIIGNSRSKYVLLFNASFLLTYDRQPINVQNLNSHNLGSNPNSISKYSKPLFLTIKVDQNLTLAKETFDEQINKEFKNDTTFIVRKLRSQNTSLSFLKKCLFYVGVPLFFLFVTETLPGFVICCVIYWGFLKLCWSLDKTKYIALDVPKNELYDKVQDFLGSKNYNDKILIQEFINLERTDKSGIVYVNGNKTNIIEVDNIYDKLSDDTYDKYNFLLSSKSNQHDVPVLYVSRSKIDTVESITEANIDDIKNICGININTEPKAETFIDHKYEIYWCRKGDILHIIQIKYT